MQGGRGWRAKHTWYDLLGGVQLRDQEQLPNILPCNLIICVLYMIQRFPFQPATTTLLPVLPP